VCGLVSAAARATPGGVAVAGAPRTRRGRGRRGRPNGGRRILLSAPEGRSSSPAGRRRESLRAVGRRSAWDSSLLLPGGRAKRRRAAILAQGSGGFIVKTGAAKVMGCAATCAALRRRLRARVAHTCATAWTCRTGSVGHRALLREVRARHADARRPLRAAERVQATLPEPHLRRARAADGLERQVRDVVSLLLAVLRRLRRPAARGADVRRPAPQGRALPARRAF
jgi:hypothetical protein